MKIILLTGIPGMGKTEIGNQLKNYYGFYHVDLEEPHINSSPEFVQFNQVSLIPEQLMEKIKKRERNTVITWGFYPAVHDPLLLKLQELGAILFWLDGDRNLAKKAWKNRNNPIADHSLFDLQISRIDSHDIQSIFSPINLDTLDKSMNKHRDIEEIVKEIFRKVGI